MNAVQRLRKRAIVLILATNLLVGAIVGCVLHYGFPDYYFTWYPSIPVYFTVLGIVMSSIMFRHSKDRPEKIIHIYMTMRAVKLLVTIGSILLYDWIIGERKLLFGITTIGFYFLYLFIETYFFYRFEKLVTKGIDR